MTTDPLQTQLPETSFYGWKNVWLLIYVYIAMGIVTYTFTVIFPVMLDTLNWSRGDASLAISISRMLTGFVLTPSAAFILNKIGARNSIVIGIAILLTGLFLLVSVTTKLWHWYIIYGVIMPVGAVLCGILPVQLTIMTWFNIKRATVIGIVTFGAPFAGSIAQPIYTWVMQHTGKWQTGWLISALFCLIAFVTSFWIRNKPSDLGQYPDGISPGETVAGEKKAPVARTHRTTETWTVREIFATRTMWIYVGVSMLQGLPFGLINFHGILHLTDIGYTSMQAANVLMAITFSSATARFPMGWLGDRIEPRWIITGALFFLIIGFAGFWKAPSFSALMVLGPILGFSIGTMIIMMTAIIPNYYGPEAYPGIRGIMSPPRTLITANFPALAGYVADRTGTYNSMFQILIVGLVISLILSLLLSPPEKKPVRS